MAPTHFAWPGLREDMCSVFGSDNDMLQNSLHSLRQSPQSRFHLLVPASSANRNLCQTLLSAIILNYPPPILINWDATETDNAYDMHMGKIDKVLAYLEDFPEEQDDDLVLMVDGYDVWFQLPPEPLIRRYFQVIDAQNERIRSTYGPDVAKKQGFWQTVLFGPDKACWPNSEGGRPACWAVPTSPLPDHAFGPPDDPHNKGEPEDSYHSRPRWLNSGTIMGPARDVRALLQAVAARVQDHREGLSDQFYFATIWGFQEWARLQTLPNITLPSGVTPPDLVKEVGNSHKIEYHVGLDYESALFQTIGYYDPYLTWLQYDSISSGSHKDTPLSEIDRFELPQDVGAARPPLAALKDPKGQELSDLTKPFFSNTKNLRLKQWHELPLLTNIVTRHVSPLLHFMMEKDYRVKWWDRMWFTPFARNLLQASATATNIPIFKTSLNGKLWTNAQGPIMPHNSTSTGGRRDGAWSDKGKWITWASMCAPYEDFVLGADLGPIYNEG